MLENDQMFNELFKNHAEKPAGIKLKSTGTDEIIIIVDRSGSMQSMQVEAQGGINGFIEEQTKIGKANLTLVEFDTHVNVVFNGIDINEATEYKLKPRGMTALLDAIGQTIADKEKYTTDDGKTIVVVMTDGNENSSKEWKSASINKLINERKEDGWEFMFLAAGQDAIKVGQQYGFDKDDTVSFASSGEGVYHAQELASNYTRGIRSGSKSAALDTKAKYVADNAEFLSDTGAVGDVADVINSPWANFHKDH